MGYLIVSLFPLCFLFKSPIRFIYWGLCLFIVFLGAKRGALLLASSLVVMSVFLTVKNVKTYQKILLLVIAGLGLYYFFDYFGDNFIYTLNRLQESGLESHSRQDIQAKVFDGFLNGNPIHWFIGYGPIGTLHLSTNFAHNDWIEILADYGMLGFIPYALFYVYLVKFWTSIRKTDYTLSFILLSALICCIYKSMLSMCFYSIENCVLMYAIGYVIAKKGDDMQCSTMS
ncbi:MAG: O-antigen ligase family protein [Prevotellaceae bacterium]|nr:O-antigen ligase family protein [Candidatus Colivivens equi]